MIDSGYDEKYEERLLGAVVEQLKAPLLHIAHSVELGQPEALGEIGISVSRALRLIDSYVRSTGQQQLALEPVSVSSVLYDVAHALSPLAKQYGSELQISIAGRYGPVMGNRDSLEVGLLTIGQSLLEAAPGNHPLLLLSVYKNRSGISAGVFGQDTGLTPQSFRRSLNLFGSTRQPLPTGSAANGAGLYIAHRIFETMAAPLKVARYHKLSGLAASFQASTQLQLV